MKREMNHSKVHRSQQLAWNVRTGRAMGLIRVHFLDKGAEERDWEEQGALTLAMTRTVHLITQEPLDRGSCSSPHC